uniref:TFIIS N-terminal domain-containing protein n=1 Tax=Oryza brachyantha TaxID=4533 RepID=J3LMU9_ORYBR
MAAPQRPLRRWNPFLAAFSSVDDAIEAADPGLLSRDEFRRARGRVVEMLRGAEDDAEAEELCLVLDEMMAESLLTLQIVPVTPERLATTDLAEVLGAMRKHESERIRGLATDIVRAWRATVKSDIVRMRSALERIPQSPKRVETGPNLEAKVKQGSSAPKKAIPMAAATSIRRRPQRRRHPREVLQLLAVLESRRTTRAQEQSRRNRRIRRRICRLASAAWATAKMASSPTSVTPRSWRH